MPKVSYPGNIPDQYAYASLYYSDSFTVASTSESVVVLSFSSHTRIVLSGTNLDASDSDADSVVRKVSFETEDREVYTTFSNGQYDFEHLYGTLVLRGVQSLYMDLLKKNDTITGSARGDGLLGGAGRDVIDGRGGFDLIDGGSGNDKLTGGADATIDYFEFNARSGHDVITDFEARDSKPVHDLLFVYEIIPDYEVHKVKGGIEVEIADGRASVILLGVSKNEFGDSDFEVHL